MHRSLSGREYVLMWCGCSFYVPSWLCIAFQKSFFVLLPRRHVEQTVFGQVVDVCGVCKICTHGLVALKVLCNAALRLIG